MSRESLINYLKGSKNACKNVSYECVLHMQAIDQVLNLLEGKDIDNSRGYPEKIKELKDDSAEE